MKPQTMDMCSGAIASKVLRFAIPIMISSSLQLFFNAADTAVVGRFAGSSSLAAVGSTSVLIFLITQLFMGLSIGVNVLAARYYAAKSDDRLSRVVQTSVTLAAGGGFVLLLLGIVTSGFFLRLTGTPDNVMSLASLYIRLYFLGMPAMTIYNFGSTILRAIGDTKRPMIYLSVSGAVNVGLNLLFVIVFHMDVAGVALATVISQCISAVLVIRALLKMEGAVRLIPSKMRIDTEILKEILRLGVPAAVQGMLFSISNTMIQASVNSFGATAIAGNTAACSLEGFVIMAMEAIYQANITFTSQNVGAGRYDRLNRIVLECVGLAAGIGIAMGEAVVFFGPQLLGIYTQDPDVITCGMVRVTTLCSVYFLYGVLNTIAGSLRGFGYSLVPTIITLVTMCLYRIVWILTVFAHFRSTFIIYLSFPTSWILALVVYVIAFFLVRRHLPYDRREPVQ